VTGLLGFASCHGQVNVKPSTRERGPAWAAPPISQLNAVAPRPRGRAPPTHHYPSVLSMVVSDGGSPTAPYHPMSKVGSSRAWYSVSRATTQSAGVSRYPSPTLMSQYPAPMARGLLLSRVACDRRRRRRSTPSCRGRRRRMLYRISAYLGATLGSTQALAQPRDRTPSPRYPKLCTWPIGGQLGGKPTRRNRTPSQESTWNRV
jgi:hypothetical protein